MKNRDVIRPLYEGGERCRVVKMFNAAVRTDCSCFRDPHDGEHACVCGSRWAGAGLDGGEVNG